MKRLSSVDRVHDNRNNGKTVILQPNIHKPLAFCEWKAKAFENLFETIYGVKINLEIGEDQFESSDFIVDRNINIILNRLLTKKKYERPLQVCVIGGIFGGTAILNLAQLKPGHLFVVTWHNEDDNNRLAKNVNCFFDTVSEHFKKKETDHPYLNAQIDREPESFEQYESKDNKERILEGVCSLHNRLPWIFFEWCPQGFEFDVIEYNPQWNLKYQQGMLDMKRTTSKSTPRENFEMRFNPELYNDLKFFENEASHFVTLKNMDLFFLQEMVRRKITSKFIVITIRGKVTNEEWKRLHSAGSLLTKRYKVINQIEQFPNERIERLHFNPITQEYDKMIEKQDLPGKERMREAKDVNGGIHSQVITVICEKSDEFYDLDVTCTDISYIELYEKWYGKYMNIRDSAKYGLLVDKRTHEPLCERIEPGPSRVDIFSEFDIKLRHLKPPNLPEEYITRIPARKRRIEVQIEDLEFLLREFEKFEKQLQSNISIPPERYQKMMKCVAHGEYSYKYNDGCISQADTKDTAERKEFGKELIMKKTKLFYAVHHIMYRIEDLCHWKMADVIKHPDALERLSYDEDEYKRKKGKLCMNTSTYNTQLSAESRPMTIGGGLRCYGDDYLSRDNLDYLEEKDPNYDAKTNADADQEERAWSSVNNKQGHREKQFTEKTKVKGFTRPGFQSAVEKIKNEKKNNRQGDRKEDSYAKYLESNSKSPYYCPAATNSSGPDSDGFQTKKRDIKSNERKQAEMEFLDSVPGMWWKKIVDLGFDPKQIENENPDIRLDPMELSGVHTSNPCGMERLFHKAELKAKKQENAESDEYFIRMIKLLGYNPLTQPEYKKPTKEMKKCYERIKKEIEKIEETREEREKYYLDKLKKIFVDLENSQYIGLTYEQIYLAEVRSSGFKPVTYEDYLKTKVHMVRPLDSYRNQNSNNSKSTHDEERVSDSTHGQQTHPVPGKTWDEIQSDRETYPEAIPEGLPGMEETTPEQKKQITGHNNKHTKWELYSEEYDVQNPDVASEEEYDEDFYAFIHEVKKFDEAQVENPYAAWSVYQLQTDGNITTFKKASKFENIRTSGIHSTSKQKRHKQSQSTSRQDSYEHEVVPTKVAGLSWKETIEDLIMMNKSHFPFGNDQEAMDFLEFFPKYYTIDLWDFDKNNDMRDVSLEPEQENKLIELFEEIRNDRCFQSYARKHRYDYKTPSQIIEARKKYLKKRTNLFVAEFEWFEKCDDFFGYNFDKFGFSSEYEARRFVDNVEILYTQDLWPEDEYEWFKLAGQLDEESVRYICDMLTEIYKDENFQKMPKLKQQNKNFISPNGNWADLSSFMRT
jgi:hypothetical protein